MDTGVALPVITLTQGVGEFLHVLLQVAVQVGQTVHVPSGHHIKQPCNAIDVSVSLLVVFTTNPSKHTRYSIFNILFLSLSANINHMFMCIIVSHLYQK